MSEQQAPAGWTRYQMKSKMGAGRDYHVFDTASGVEKYMIDGHVGTRPKAEVKDADGNDIYQVRGNLLGIPKHVTISTAAGDEVATLKAKAFSPIKTHMHLEAVSGESWDIEGELLEKDYTITAAGKPVVNISQKWVTVRDSYSLDILDGIDPALALAVMWSIDRWVEHD